MRDVAVIGVGMVRFGELWGQSLREIFLDAALNAIDDAGVDHVDALVVGCMSGGLFVEQGHVAGLLADALAMGPIPGTCVECAGASGGMAVRSGFIEVASGMSDIVLVAGVEKMTDLSTAAATSALAATADQEYEAFHGVTLAGLYAMMARTHMERFGTTSAQLAAVAVKNHAHGALNPLAQFQRPITVEGVLNSVMVADPLHVLDCAPAGDGAAAAVLCSLETAKSICKKPIVRVAGVGCATDRFALYRRQDMTRLQAVERSGKAALDMAGKAPRDIDVAEVHDCFTIAEIMVLEELGLVERGKGADAATSGVSALGGKIPVNTGGGLKARGHPIGASGVAQIHEIVQQLRGDAGERQVAGARIALAQNMGGSGGSSVVHILERL